MRPALTVSTVASFAATWLVPRLGRFTSRHPDIDVRLHTSGDRMPVGRGPRSVDVAIRHGLGVWEKLEAARLLQPRLVPVGSPALLMADGPIQEPAECLRHPLLQDADRADWTLWLRAHGIDDPRGRAKLGPSFSDGHLLIRAAAAGQGLALVRDTYAADEIATGRLSVAFDAPFPVSFAYYVVTQPGAASRTPQIAAFKDWVLEEAAAETVTADPAPATLPRMKSRAG